MQAPVMSLSPDDGDPLSLRPPAFETVDELRTRMAMEQKAKEISDRIDEELEKARIAERKGPKPIKILLLGTSSPMFSTPVQTDPCNKFLPYVGQSESGELELYSVTKESLSSLPII